MRGFFDKTTLSMAVAIFSMFFGAGNAVFPLLLGMEAQAQLGWAFFGLALTAIGGPLLGLLGGTLFQGRCVDFFGRTGRIPGAILLGVSLALLGPLAVLPRCVTVAHAAVELLIPSLPLWLFACVFGLLVVLGTWRRRLMLATLGYVLSPLLIACLFLIIVQGVRVESYPVEAEMSAWSAFYAGISTGYDTMDLIASIIFSSGIWTMVSFHYRNDQPKILRTTLQAGALACLLLGASYLGLGYSAACFSPLMADIEPQQVMTRLAALALGPNLGVIANIAIALACLTTVMSLSMTLSDIACKEIFPGRLSYRPTLIGIILLTTAMANVGFASIMHMIHPVVTVCYPIIIALTVVNIVYKLRA